VPAARAGNPMRNRSSVSAPIVPVLPNQSAAITNTETPTGWNTARCSAGGQPRRLHHTVAAMPASPVAPPITPLRMPMPPSATGPALVAEPSFGRHKLYTLKTTSEDDPDRNAESRRGGPPQQLGTNRHADRAADQKWSEAAKLDRPA
jgi:hypothetical protein